MRGFGPFDLDGVPGEDLARLHDDGHDSGEANQVARRVSMHQALEQCRVDLLELFAGLPQAGHLDDGFTPEGESGPRRQAEKIETGD